MKRGCPQNESFADGYIYQSKEPLVCELDTEVGQGKPKLAQIKVTRAILVVCSRPAVSIPPHRNAHCLPWDTQRRYGGVRTMIEGHFQLIHVLDRDPFLHASFTSELASECGACTHSFQQHSRQARHWQRSGTLHGD